jgi:hypothetical protein
MSTHTTQPKQLFMFAANQELITSLVKVGARFIVVGSLAVHYHVPERQAADLDILIEPSADTAEKVIAVLSSCPLIHHTITVEQLLRPKRIQIPAKVYFNADILTPGESIDFDYHWRLAHDARVGTALVKVAAIETLMFLLSQSSELKHAQDIELLNRANG